MRLGAYVLVSLLLFVPRITCNLSSDGVEYIGCYDIGYSLRADYHHHIPELQITLDKCVDFCKNEWKTQFAGVEARDGFCYCGNDIDVESLPRNDSLCDVQCPDKPQRTCGGLDLLSLYEIEDYAGKGINGSTTTADKDIKDATNTDPIIDDIPLLLGMNTGLRRYYSSRYPYSEHLLSTNGAVDTVDYHFSKNLIFFISEETLYKTALNGNRNGLSATQVRKLSMCFGFAVDWVQDRIYWANCDSKNMTSIMTMGLNGEAVTTLVTSPELTDKVITRMEVDPYKGLLFWTADRIFYSLEISTKDFLTKSKVRKSVLSFSLDLQQQRVFYVQAGDGTYSLLSMNYDGEEVRKHFTNPQLSGVFNGLAIVDGQVFWIENEFLHQIIYKAPINVNNSREIKFIAIIDEPVSCMKVYHPGLQKPPRRDPCQDKGCSHTCVTLNSTSALCQCPEGQELDSNGICYIRSGSFPDRAKYQGCYNTSSQAKRHSHLLFPFKVDQCFTLCSGLKSVYAGLNSINSTCYCGNDILRELKKEDNSLCKPCPEDEELSCGGSFALSLYNISFMLKPGHKVVDGLNGNPRFLLAGHDGVYMYNSTARKLHNVIRVNHSIVALDYHYQNKEGFAIWNEALYRFPLFGEAPISEESATHLADMNRCFTFAVDWVHDKVFFPDCDFHVIRSIDIKNDTENNIIHLPQGAWAMDMVIDPYKGLLFWTTGATLMSCRLDGRELKKLNPQFPTNKVSSISLDMGTERVYFAGADKDNKNATKLFYTSYSGLTSGSIQFIENDEFRLLSFGILNSFIYFAKEIHRNSSIVIATKLEYAHKPTAYALGEDIQVTRLKLVHPKLQLPAKIDACTYRGCSHICLLEDSLPECYCPRWHFLSHDNITCTFDPGEEEEFLFLKIMWGIILVLFVLLAAGVLMFLTDKAWTKLHPTVVRLSNPKEGRITFTRDNQQDCENLI